MDGIESKSGFLIPLSGLQSGKTEFGLKAGKEFFESFENTEILDASLGIQVTVEKTSGHADVDCHISGEVTVSCDRCLEALVIPTDVLARLRIRYGEEDPALTAEDESQRGRESVWIPATSEDLDLSQIVYDYVCLSLPQRKVHQQGRCNAEVLKYLASGIRISDGDSYESGNPFSVLDGLFKN